LYTARDEVVAEVRKAPARRVDNVLAHLYDAVRQLQMHTSMIQDLQRRWSRLYWQCRWHELGVAASGTTVTGLLSAWYSHSSTAAVAAAAGSGVEAGVVAGVVAATLLATGGLTWYHAVQMREWEQQAVTMEELSATFQRTHARAISEGDEYTAALWQRIRDPLRAALQQQPSIGTWPTIKVEEMQQLQNILDVEIPDLRRQVSPSHYGKDDGES